MAKERSAARSSISILRCGRRSTACLAPGGHLGELEEAFQQGKIADYCLFQKGRLRKGRIPLERHLRSPGPIDLGSLIDLFKDFEEQCGVEHVHGRSFYGLRRALTDIAPHYTTDARELDRMTGHEDPTTRERMYQDRLREEFREGAAEARRMMRSDLTAGRTPPKPRRRRSGANRPADEVHSALREVLGAEVEQDQARAIAHALGLE